LHTGPRVRRAPGLPCALLLERVKVQEHNSDATRRENAESWIRHCEERKRRSNPESSRDSGLLRSRSQWRTNMPLSRSSCPRRRASSTLRLLNLSTAVSGIMDRPVKPDDDNGMSGCLKF